MNSRREEEDGCGVVGVKADGREPLLRKVKRDVTGRRSVRVSESRLPSFFAWPLAPSCQWHMDVAQAASYELYSGDLNNYHRRCRQ